jgi:hypothetical protein
MELLLALVDAMRFERLTGGIFAQIKGKKALSEAVVLVLYDRTPVPRPPVAAYLPTVLAPKPPLYCLVTARDNVREQGLDGGFNIT